MKLIKWLFAAVFTLLLIASAALAVFVINFDANHYRPQIINLVETQTGRALKLEGELGLSVFPSIAIKLGEAELGNAQGFDKANFAKIKAARVSVKFMPLLEEKLEVETAELHGLVLNLQRKADGSNNWSDLISENEGKADQSTPEIVEKLLAGLVIAGINLDNARIHWQDALSGKDIKLAPLQLKTGVFRPNKPLDIALETRLIQAEPATILDIALQTRALFQPETQQLELSRLRLSTRLSGDLVPDGNIESELSGNVQGNLKSQLFSIPDLQLESTITGQPAKGGVIRLRLNGNTQAELQSGRISIPDLTTNLNIEGEIARGGYIQADLKADARFDLNSQQLRLNDLQLHNQIDRGFVPDGDISNDISGQALFDVVQKRLKIDDLHITGNVNAPTIPGGVLRHQAQGQLALNLAKSQGELDLNTLNAEFANIQLAGKLKIEDVLQEPLLSGQILTQPFSLREFLQQQGQHLPAMQSTAALQRVKADVEFIANTKGLTLSKLRIDLDESVITGQFALRDFAKATPAIEADLNVNRLNLDHYLPPKSESDNSATQSAPPGPLLPLAALRNLNIKGQLSIADFTTNNVKLQNVHLGVSAKDGIVNANPIKAKLYKGKYEGHIRIDAQQNTPKITIEQKLSALHSEGLLFDLFADRYVSGKAFFTSKVTTQGNTSESALRNLQGYFNMEFHDGTIRDSKLAQRVAVAVHAFENRQQDKTGQTEVKFTKLVSDWAINNGVLQTENAHLEAPLFQVIGKGDVDVPRKYVDMKLAVGRPSKKDREDLFAPFHVHGPFGDMSYELELDVLLKSLAKQRLDEKKAEELQKLEELKKQKLEELQRKKQEHLDELQRRRDEELQKLRDRRDEELRKLQEQREDAMRRLQEEREKYQQQLQEEKDRQLEQLEKSAGDELKDKFGNELNQLEQQFGDQIRDIFR